MKQKKSLIWIALFLLFLVGCKGDKGGVKVYQDTEETKQERTEVSVTAVISEMNIEAGYINVIDCMTDRDMRLYYHGGVSVTDTYGSMISIDKISCGAVVDIVYYSDTDKMVSMQLNSKTTVLREVKKFSANPDEEKACYKGTTVKLWSKATAYDEGKRISLNEVSTEDEVTLWIFNNKLVSVAVTTGHGYVRLLNQDSYIGGMVEIGYDVIVPVTADMLIPVEEGDYLLRINKSGYSNTKQVRVKKDTEIAVDLSSIAIPSGTVSFVLEPKDAKDVTITVAGEDVYGETYTNLYGTYNLSVSAKGYKPKRGQFTIDKDWKEIKIRLTEDPDAKATDTDSTTEATTAATTRVTTRSATDTPTTRASTEEIEGTGKVTENKFKVSTPKGAGVYVDGDYVGDAPVTIDKVVGTHTITLYKSGYIIKSYTVQSLDDGKDQEFSYPELTKLDPN